MKTLKIEPKTEGPDFSAPPHLSTRAQEMWNAVVPRRARSLERLLLVQTALEGLDRADSAATEIAKNGMTSTTKSSGTVHFNPLLRIERESRQLFAKIWLALGLQWSYDIDGHQWT